MFWILFLAGLSMLAPAVFAWLWAVALHVVLPVIVVGMIAAWLLGE